MYYDVNRIDVGLQSVVHRNLSYVVKFA